MSQTAVAPTEQDVPVEHVDVLIVGAGISGVGGAYHLQTQRPARRSSSSRVWRASAAPG